VEVREGPGEGKEKEANIEKRGLSISEKRQGNGKEGLESEGGGLEKGSKKVEKILEGDCKREVWGGEVS